MQTTKPTLELDNASGINNLLSKEKNYVDIVYTAVKHGRTVIELSI